MAGVETLSRSTGMDEGLELTAEVAKRSKAMGDSSLVAALQNPPLLKKLLAEGHYDGTNSRVVTQKDGRTS